MGKINKLSWIEDHLPEEAISVPMHDGMGYYWREKLVLILIESSQTPIHRGVRYPFQIWNGCFFPVDKMKQNTVIGQFLFLENHPALKDCLYLPSEDENFEELALKVIREVFRGNPLFGRYVQIKKSKSKKSNAVIDGLKPTLFLDDFESEEKPIEKPKKKSERLKANSKKKKTDKKAENNFILAKIK